MKPGIIILAAFMALPSCSVRKKVESRIGVEAKVETMKEQSQQKEKVSIIDTSSVTIEEIITEDAPTETVIDNRVFKAAKKKTSTRRIVIRSGLSNLKLYDASAKAENIKASAKVKVEKKEIKESKSHISPFFLSMLFLVFLLAFPMLALSIKKKKTGSKSK